MPGGRLERRSRRSPAIPVLALGLLAACSGCSPGESPATEGAGSAPHGIVLLVLDTVRADRLTPYGYERDTTPALDRLAARGALFREAQAPAPWTLPSVASLWTGLPPTVHGAGSSGDGPRKFHSSEGLFVFSESLPTLPGRMRELGYRTYARIANPLLGKSCYTAGFDEVEVSRDPADVMVGWVEERLDLLREQPFFLYLHFMDSHVPLAPPTEDVARYLSPEIPLESLGPAVREASRWSSFRKVDDPRRPAVRNFAVVKQATYDGALHFLDNQIDRLMRDLDGAGLLGDTLVVVTADHGEEFWDHWDLEMQSYLVEDKTYVGCSHGHTLFQELLHVPLIVAGPGVQAGVVVPARVPQLDLGETLLDLADPAGSLPALGDGASLAPLLRGAQGAGKAIFSENVAHGYELKSIVAPDGYKLIHAMNPAEKDLLFDLEADPRETRDLLADEPQVAARLLRSLEATMRDLERRRVDPGTPDAGFDATVLQDLGYADGDDR